MDWSSVNLWKDGEDCAAPPQLLSPHSVTDLLHSVDAFLFDCDGVIWKGDKLIMRQTHKTHRPNQRDSQVLNQSGSCSELVQPTLLDFSASSHCLPT